MDNPWPWPCCEFWQSRTKIRKKKDPTDKTLTLMNFHFSTGMWLCVGPGEVGPCAFTFSDVRQAARNQIRWQRASSPMWKMFCNHQAPFQRLQGFRKRKSTSILFGDQDTKQSFWVVAQIPFVSRNEQASRVFLIHYLLPILPKRNRFGVLTHLDWLRSRKVSCDAGWKVTRALTGGGRGCHIHLQSW